MHTTAINKSFHKPTTYSLCGVCHVRGDYTWREYVSNMLILLIEYIIPCFQHVVVAAMPFQQVSGMMPWQAIQPS